MRKVSYRAASVVGLGVLWVGCGSGPVEPVPPVAPMVVPGAVAVGIENLVYVDLGEPAPERNERGLWIETEGMVGIGTADCNGVQDCIDAGVDGRPVVIRQDAQVIIDVIGAGVVETRGFTQGTIALIVRGQTVTRSFAGPVTGSSTCVAGVCDVSLTVVARAQRASEVRLDLTGQVDVAGDQPVWSNLGGTGIVSMDDVDQI